MPTGYSNKTGLPLNPPSRKGAIMPESAKQKIKEFNLKTGKKPPSHKGKKYKEIYGKKWKDEIEKRRKTHIETFNKKGRKIHRDKHDSREGIEWRLKIYKRDNFTCQSCGRVGSKLNAHHIKEWINFPELRFDINNGITLCFECHKLFHKLNGKQKRNKR